MHVRSSITHPLEIAELPTAYGGSVGVTFCPGKCGASLYGHTWKRDLDTDLDVIEQWGTRVVLTLVEPFELQALEVEALGERVQSRGLRWLHLPIPDVSVPTATFERQWHDELPGLLATLREGGKTLVHCKGGLGRAGMVAALLLIETGERPEVAIRKVREVRPGAIQTAAQQRYVTRYRAYGVGR